MKIKEVIEKYVKRLGEKKIEDTNLKVKMLLMRILNVSKAYFVVYSDEEFPEEKLENLETMIKRLENNEPIQYILINQEFYGLDFYVDENVLIPQPDTEILVEECIKIGENIKKDFQNYCTEVTEPLKILDLCTGSGAIGISLRKNIEKSKVVVSDICEKALEIAKKNAIQNKVEITVIQSDLFENINEKFHIIVSNPPYIESKTIEFLSEEVKKEPHLALDGGEDGLKFYKEIAKKAKEYLEENGYLALEIGYNQRISVEKILKENGYKNIYSKKDFGGNDRIVIAQKLNVKVC